MSNLLRNTRVASYNQILVIEADREREKETFDVLYVCTVGVIIYRIAEFLYQEILGGIDSIASTL